jgi:hypothetical protein
VAAKEKALEKELKLAPDLIGKMGAVEFLSLLTKCFPPRRATELIGWAVLLGAAGIENGPKLRHALDQAGYSESAFYRALADFRKFGEFVEERYHAKMSVVELVRKISPAT